jgi:hypothetical protein
MMCFKKKTTNPTVIRYLDLPQAEEVWYLYIVALKPTKLAMSLERPMEPKQDDIMTRSVEDSFILGSLPPSSGLPHRKRVSKSVTRTICVVLANLTLILALK